MPVRSQGPPIGEAPPPVGPPRAARQVNHEATLDPQTAKNIDQRMRSLLQTYSGAETNAKLRADTEAKIHVFFQALQNNQVSDTVGQLVLQMLIDIE